MEWIVENKSWLFSGVAIAVPMFLLSIFVTRQISKSPRKFSGNITYERDRKRLARFLEKNFRKIVELDISGIEHADRYTPPQHIDFPNRNNHDSLTINNYGEAYHFLDGHLIIKIQIVKYEMHQGAHFGAIAVDNK